MTEPQPFKRPIRILVTGSRKWRTPETVWQSLEEAWHDATQVYPGHPLIVVHGDYPAGADYHALVWARTMDRTGEPVSDEPHPADWGGDCPPTCPTEDPEHRKPRSLGGTYCPKAGLRRNQNMVDLGADLCLAFIRNRSAGASFTAARAEEAGIPTRRFTA